jgi:hypothetical protein
MIKPGRVALAFLKHVILQESFSAPATRFNIGGFAGA